MVGIGERIAEARKASKLSQEALGAKVGLTKSAISQIENGSTKNPRPENVFNIADALGVDPRQLVFGGTTTSPRKPDLSAKEQELLNWFRWMSPEAQQAFIGHAQVWRVVSAEPAAAEMLESSRTVPQ